jgi:hypothetical protein
LSSFCRDFMSWGASGLRSNFCFTAAEWAVQAQGRPPPVAPYPSSGSPSCKDLGHKAHCHLRLTVCHPSTELIGRGHREIPHTAEPGSWPTKRALKDQPGARVHPAWLQPSCPIAPSLGVQPQGRRAPQAWSLKK